MSGGDGVLKVDPDQVRGTAGRMRVRAADFITGGPPDTGDADWPSHQAIAQFYASVDGANRAFHGRMNDTADGLDAAANSYTKADQNNAQHVGALGAKDALSMATATSKDIATAVTGAVTPFISALAGATGALGSAVASGGGALGNAAAQIGGQMATTRAKLNTPTPDAGIPGGGGSGAGTNPAAAQTALTHRTNTEGGRPVGALGDRVKTVAQQQPKSTVMPGASAMPMSGMTGRGAAGRGLSSTRARTYTIVTTKPTEEDDDARADT
jgi:hypothetical protein